ncbi:MAG: 23S rRNA (guanosine(2251)-2'-O)-methyltransferase RlmB [bacterium]|nr:23S rRNA (guanosine(2251)-2'-O)-methyltransferase RlmB [bacterium]
MDKEEIIFGRNPVLEYIRNASSNKGLRLHVAQKAHGKIIETITGSARAKKIAVSIEGKDFFSRLGTSSKHQGVALSISGSARTGHAINEKEMLSKVSEKKGVLVLLDQLTDPHNVGSIIRTAEALGVDGIIIPKSNSTGINATVVKASAGATAYVDILTIANVSIFLERAKEEGFWIIGTSDHGNKELSGLDKYRPAVIIIGSEGKGMRRLTEEKCDAVVRIPLKGKINSLNASVAAGIVLYAVLSAADPAGGR